MDLQDLNTTQTNGNGSGILYHIEEILNKVIKEKASDLYLTVGMPPIIRQNGQLRSLGGFGTFEKDEIRNLIDQLLSEEQLTKLFEEKEIDAQYSLKNKGRFRINAFFEKESLSATLRLIPDNIPTLEELNLPPHLYEFCKLPQGLVLITGPSGVGKSTTLASLISWINANQNRHILTIEDPIEFLFESDKSLVHQRELYVDTNSWTNALRSVRRATVDVLLIGEIRDYETMGLAINAASMGHLVFTTIHTYSAAQTVEHIFGLFPEHMKSQIKMQLAAVLEGIITQKLIESKDRTRRFPALEVMLTTDAIKNTIREGKTHFLDNLIATSYGQGMIPMERSLAELAEKGLIEVESALANTLRPEEVLRYLKSGRK